MVSSSTWAGIPSSESGCPLVLLFFPPHFWSRKDQIEWLCFSLLTVSILPSSLNSWYTDSFSFEHISIIPILFIVVLSVFHLLQLSWSVRVPDIISLVWPGSTLTAFPSFPSPYPSSLCFHISLSSFFFYISLSLPQIVF